MLGREGRKVRRVTLPKPVKVKMGSIGSGLRYDLSTRDVSSTGFFLEFEKPGRFPFTASSIMEIWLDLFDFGTIFFNGKMARIVFPEDEAASILGPGIAVRIIQISTEDEKRLVDFLRSYDEMILSPDGEEDQGGDTQSKDTPPLPSVPEAS